MRLGVLPDRRSALHYRTGFQRGGLSLTVSRSGKARLGEASG